MAEVEGHRLHGRRAERINKGFGEVGGWRSVIGDGDR